MSVLNNNRVRLGRNSLRDQAVKLLREQIISGHIPPGTKISERDVGEWFGISRMPARDALMELEEQGLIISKSNSRYVIDLDEPDVRNLYQVRRVLERLATELAALNDSPQKCVELTRVLQDMQDAIERDDPVAFRKSDIEAHQLIWRYANNPHLLNMLNSIIGPIFMFIASHISIQDDWYEVLELHEMLTSAICANDVQAALTSLDDHMDNSLRLSLRAFKPKPEPITD